MAKKDFTNPIQGKNRKGIDILISNNTKVTEQPSSVEPKVTYTTSNVRISDVNREMIYTLKGRTGMSLTDLYNMIFKEYFKNNPL